MKSFMEKMFARVARAGVRHGVFLKIFVIVSASITFMSTSFSDLTMCNVDVL
jgi:hypothetical protein